MNRRARACIVSTALALLVACGTSRPPISNDEFLPVGGSDAAVADAASSSPEFAPADPACTNFDAGREATRPCGCSELSLLGDRPNLYFAIDRSSSMTESGKLATVRKVAADLISALGPRANFGAALFPDPYSADACAAGRQVLALTPGDSPAGSVGPVTLAFVRGTNWNPGGGTPTAAALRALLPILSQAEAKARTFLILATDGGPNCDASTSCDSSGCIPNIEGSSPACAPSGATNCCTPAAYGATQCLDAKATTDAVAALLQAGIPTFVIGIPGSAPYASLLDELAVAGGTAQETEPRYYAVASTGSGDLETALRHVAAKVTASCALTLAAPPSDPNDVNVYLDATVVPRDPVNGWTLDSANLTHLTLAGDACQRLLSGDVVSLRVIEGCPTVVR